MASTQFTLLAVFAVLLPSIAVATQHVVGDDQGWTINFNYTAWAASKVFRVGDSLLFNYNPQKHNVYKANQTEFQQCIIPPVNPLTSGKDVIPINSTGKKWYICGVAEHCSKLQMKLAINVLEAQAPAPAPTSPVTPGGPGPSSSAFSVEPSTVSKILAAALAAAAVSLAAF